MRDLSLDDRSYVDRTLFDNILALYERSPCWSTSPSPVHAPNTPLSAQILAPSRRLNHTPLSLLKNYLQPDSPSSSLYSILSASVTTMSQQPPNVSMAIPAHMERPYHPLSALVASHRFTSQHQRSSSERSLYIRY
ncbi:hypothetical protein BDN70DRAFT_937438 [Pholiota conissans]|uniref:Uncharacterized protein n=1 Tax=Pholiota conissans TaxID=109636 RepID=A0A9P5YPB4_9AGAR|nr:hypothetical protein BDN70DRAFT_937438 [Pholiota conissans]